ncbi:MAG: hypothetical protein V3T77_01530 [Planctomycetota bacterium]
MKPTDANRPLRVFDKALRGGLGAGNLGVIMSRRGTGKIAVLTCIAIDHSMDGKNTLHVAVGKSVSDIRALHDEVLREILQSLDLRDSIDHQNNVERHKQIYTYQDGSFTLDRLNETLDLLATHADFKPELIELQGWPDFQSISESELRTLKEIAVEHQAEVWLTAQTTRTDNRDERGVPDYVARHEALIEVLVALEPKADHVRLRFIKTHKDTPPDGLNLEFDPKTMLIRWR